MEDLVHSPLKLWAKLRPDAIALDDGRNRISFAQLHASLSEASARLVDSHAPGNLPIAANLPVLRRIIDMLAVIDSGRCAAVFDSGWTTAMQADVREALGAQAVAAPAPTPLTPFYIGFTSGSTGTPKGFRRHHRSWVESFRVCIDTFGDAAASRIAVACSISHSLGLFGALLGLWTGAGVRLQEHFSGEALLRALGAGDLPCVIASPSQILVTLDLAARRMTQPIDSVRLVMISGARWMRDRTPALQALFPRARLIEFYGASETSFITWTDAYASTPVDVVGTPFANVEIEIRDTDPVEGAGRIFVRSPMLFMDYVCNDSDATRATRDDSWLSVGDVGRFDAQGRLRLAGRRNRMIVTQGKNLFPEELESVLAGHPDVVAASVQGIAHEMRGQMTTAVLQLRSGASPSARMLAAWCGLHLEPYKIPRKFFASEDWPVTASGKTDHRRLGEQLAQAEATACLRRLR